MSIRTRFRRKTAANWISDNSVLLAGEIGVDTTNRQFKVGDGVTAWNSLAVFGEQDNSANTSIRRHWGDGSWGDVTILNGQTITLDQDAYYNNLTIQAGGTLVCNGFRIFVRGVLDLTNASTGAITANGANGTNASSEAGAVGPGPQIAGSIGIGGNPGNGATGNVSNGAQASTVASIIGNGGGSGAGGAGGSGNSAATTGGGGRTASSPTAFSIRRHETNWIRGIALINGGVGGPGGGSGGGDGVALGGGGGSGGQGGGFIALYARCIQRGGSDSVIGIIQANGGNGGNGHSPSGNAGGGGGGAGGGGGYVAIFYEYLSGRKGQEFVQCNGGMGGTGGTGSGTGLGGNGGGGGAGGRVFIYNTMFARGIEVLGSPLAVGYAALGNLPGSGGLPGLCEVDL